MKQLIIANWKMSISFDEAMSLLKYIDVTNSNNELIVAPPIPYLSHISTILKNAKLCSQDTSIYKGYGAYTGEFSASVLKSMGVKYAILGHSERRTYFEEANITVRKKVENCIEHNITPIVCVGESIEIRRSGQYKDFILNQLFESLPSSNNGQIVIAYEPVWAIGSGLTPSLDEIKEISDMLHNSKELDSVAKDSYIVYGGSVGAKNIVQILEIDGIHGVLIGSASTKPDELSSILDRIF
ncbi:MAG: triose-phosphate isomerase [Rickettsiales bacterium]|nr:triose-phosphate isomerase [Rickettsiales bacterium]MCA0254010.1 triose-phosphate isomerase [Pseudomonadota bacterium]